MPKQIPIVKEKKYIQMIPAHVAAVRRNVVRKYAEIKRGNIGMGLVILASNQCIKIVADYLPKSSYNIDIECNYK